MKLTNKYNLPETIVNAIGKQYKPKPNRFSVSDMTSPPQIRHLKIEHWDKLESDSSEKMWMLMGNAVHYVLMKGAPIDSLSEEKMEVQEGDVTIVGKADLWHNGEISDWKITSVWSFILGDKPDWEAQLNLYKWLYGLKGLEVNKLTINAILRDWQKSKSLADKSYPKIPFQSVNVRMWRHQELTEFVLKAITDLSKPIPRPCTPKEQWSKPIRYALMQPDRKKAIRVFDTEEEAYDLLGMQSESKHCYIVKRQGSKIRCESYCPVRDVCEQRKREQHETPDTP